MGKIVVPPSATEAENALIGTILLNPSKFKEASGYIIDDNVFYDTRNKLLWSKIKKMLNKGEVIDQITVASDLTDKEVHEGISPFYITGLTTGALESHNLESYAQIVYKKYLMRRLIKETHSIQNEAYHANGNAFDILNETHNTIGELIELQPHKTFDIIDAMHETIESIKHSDRNLIPIGYHSIDKLCGGLTRG